MKLLGPFSQIVTLRHLPLKGSLPDDQLEVINKGAVVVINGKIEAVGTFDKLSKEYKNIQSEIIEQPAVLLPGFVDCHTHICYGGNRSADYAMRIAGKSYLEIAKAGGGIWSSVQMTRAATEEELIKSLVQRIDSHLKDGITTIEIKSGYGLNTDEELKMLHAIKRAAANTNASIVTTCLAAHIKPKDFPGSEKEYLDDILVNLLPVIRKEQLSDRVDIFIEDTAFSSANAKEYLLAAKAIGFHITVHADQFTPGSSLTAIECGALSADHLEASRSNEINALAKSNTVAVVLPGASLGLGMHFSPARELLNAGASVAIASDWNPGSAPQGDLLMQAAVLSAAEKLNTTETFAALTYRAALGLGMNDRGRIDTNMMAHLQAYPTMDHRDILYNQGKMKPFKVWN